MEFFLLSINGVCSFYSLTHTLEKVSGLAIRSLDKKERMKTFFWEQHWKSLALSLSSSWPCKEPNPPWSTNNSAQVVKTVGTDLGLNPGFAIDYLCGLNQNSDLYRGNPNHLCELLWALSVAQQTRTTHLGAWPWQRLPKCSFPALLCLQHKMREWHSVLASGFAFTWYLNPSFSFPVSEQFTISLEFIPSLSWMAHIQG